MAKQQPTLLQSRQQQSMRDVHLSGFGRILEFGPDGLPSIATRKKCAAFRVNFDCVDLSALNHVFSGPRCLEICKLMYDRPAVQEWKVASSIADLGMLLSRLGGSDVYVEDARGALAFRIVPLGLGWIAVAEEFLTADLVNSLLNDHEQVLLDWPAIDLPLDERKRIGRQIGLPQG